MPLRSYGEALVVDGSFGFSCVVQVASTTQQMPDRSDLCLCEDERPLFEKLTFCPPFFAPSTRQRTCTACIACYKNCVYADASFAPALSFQNSADTTLCDTTLRLPSCMLVTSLLIGCTHVKETSHPLCVYPP